MALVLSISAGSKVAANADDFVPLEDGKHSFFTWVIQQRCLIFPLKSLSKLRCFGCKRQRQATVQRLVCRRKGDCPVPSSKALQQEQGTDACMIMHVPVSGHISAQTVIVTDKE